MSNTYPTTQFPIGSTDVKVLYNNASNLDDYMHTLSPSIIDRFGKRRESLEGLKKIVTDFIEAMGFEATHLVYVDGSPLTVLRPTQLVDRAGSVYKVKASVTFPVTLTGTWVTDQALLVDVGDSALRSSLAAATGATLVGWARAMSLDVSHSVDVMLAAQAVNIWEFADYVVSKPTPGDSKTWDWSPAIQAACNFCNSTFPARPLAISTLCRIVTPIVINRPIDGDAVRDTFTIIGTDGGGFIVDSAISMFTSTIAPVMSGSPPQPMSVAQTIRFKGLVLTSTNAALNAFILDGNKFLRVWFESCDISKLKFAFTTSYFQSIYFVSCNIRLWQGVFIQATGGSYDVRVIAATLAEHGEDFLYLISSTSDKEVTGCSVDESCIEGLTGVAIRYAHARGMSVTNTYFEGNTQPDIIANDFPATTNKGITHSGNLHACTATNKLNINFYPVVWGATSGGMSMGNTSDHNMNDVRSDTQLVCFDNAVGEMLSNDSRSRPGDIMYGTVSPQVNNTSYGNRVWKPGSIVMNNSGAKNITGWWTPNGTLWYPFGPVDDGSYWRFPDSTGADHFRVATVDGASQETSMYVRYSNGVAQVIERVTVGAADSGGSGFRLLRLPN